MSSIVSNDHATLPGITETTSLGDAVTLLSVADSDAVAELFVKSELGNIVSDVNYTGSDSAAFLVADFAIPGAFDLSGGLFLSSGGFPGPENTSTSFSVTHGTDGDSDLSDTASAAFSGAGAVQDASVLEFNVDIDPSTADGISFDIVFGSDEYPEFSDTSFVDIAAIYVNGVNVALFNDDPLTPLSVIQANVDTGNLIDNTSGTFATEWDGFSNVLTVRAALQPGQNTIKIGVADTGDSVYDSGIYVNNIELLEDGGTGGGVLTVVDGDDGDNTIEASAKKEEINLFGGSDAVVGIPTNLNGDIITGFNIDDVIIVTGVLFNIDNVTITHGSAILNIDTDQDGTADTLVTLAGDYEGHEFHVNPHEGDAEDANNKANATSSGVAITVSTDSESPQFTEGPDTVTITEPDTVSRALGGDDDVTGSSGADTIFGDGGNDNIDGRGGNDNLAGNDGDDRLLGGAGNDGLFGGAGDDEMFGQAGNDTLRGAAGNDLMAGGTGDDDIIGGSQADRLFGGDGNDFLNGKGGFDVLRGGAGEDVLAGGPGNDLLFGGPQADSLFGGLGNDFLAGRGGFDLMRGGAGKDLLAGGGGNDSLFGGAGDDAVYGALGADMLTGGTGADAFIYKSTLESEPGTGRDTIADFSAGEGDKIRLGSIDADVTVAGNDTFNFIGTAGFSNSAGELNYFVNTAGDAVVRADVDGDGTADWEVLVTNTAVLTVDDFAL